MTLKINDAVCFFSRDSFRPVLGVISEIIKEKQARVLTLESSMGADFESYYLPLEMLQKFDLSFFEMLRKGGDSGWTLRLKMDIAKLKEDLTNREEELRDIILLFQEQLALGPPK